MSHLSLSKVTSHGEVAVTPAVRSRGERADAQQSTARILAAAKTVFTADPNASLEQVAEEAGLARATVHRRFSSRQALLDALVSELNGHYLRAFEQARVRTAPPVVALHRLTELAFELKISHPFEINCTPAAPGPGGPATDPAIHEGLDLLFGRLRAAGEIAADDPTWCRKVYLALLHEVHELPADAPMLAATGTAAADEIGARVALLVTTLMGALGGRTATGA
jgi:AcrR family transcriptional regulator